MFQFYIVDEEFQVTGTDNPIVADAAKDDPNCFAVIDVQNNKDLTALPLAIPENKVYTL